ncbi:MAG: hypothetical protein GY866_21010, partial [Proteobacteria bacterium]|nr:hypothetical protein [Pseudomonadota bacterium]
RQLFGSFVPPGTAYPLGRRGGIEFRAPNHPSLVMRLQSLYEEIQDITDYPKKADNPTAN